MVHDGQKYAEPLSYAALAPNVVAKAEALLRSMTFGGAPLMK
jgi:phosphate transport system substrate-binding protein